MTGTGRSNNDVIAEAVAAIGPYKAWIAAKRAEIQAQIAQMQAASAATITTPPSDGSLASRFRQVGLPQRNGGAGSAPLPTAPEGTAGVDATVPEAAGETVTQSALLEESVSGSTSTVSATPTPEDAPTITAALPTLQNQQAAQEYLETVFTATSPHTLLPRVVTAWEGRTADPKYNARMLIGAKEAGVLSAELAHAVSAMITFDDQFAAVYSLYEDGYKELFDIGLDGHGPDEEEQTEDAEEPDQDVDVTEGTDDEAERRWGFPDEDSRKSPF